MLTFEQLEKLVMDNVDLLEVNANAFNESRERAARFLVIQAHLSNHIKVLDDVKVKASTIEKAQSSQSLMSQSGKNVTENKINAEADPAYAAARESVEMITSEREWVKRHFEIFGNAHVLFRQFAAQNGG